MITTHELRQKYLDFFKSKDHAIISSSSLIPENDPTTLFTGSGMQPMVPYLLGEKHPMGTRIADSQKCFRAVDMDEVGDNRHTTFFEMLGNWSLGSYFKEEEMRELNSLREEILRKRRESLAKVCSCREDFEKKEREIKADLERARRLWREVGERFEWWGSLP